MVLFDWSFAKITFVAADKKWTKLYHTCRSFLFTPLPCCRYHSSCHSSLQMLELKPFCRNVFVFTSIASPHNDPVVQQLNFSQRIYFINIAFSFGVTVLFRWTEPPNFSRTSIFSADCTKRDALLIWNYVTGSVSCPSSVWSFPSFPSSCWGRSYSCGR